MSDFDVCVTGSRKVLDAREIELQKAKALLSIAKCPNAHCVDGVIQEGFPDGYEVFQCQWCAEVKELTDG